MQPHHRPNPCITEDLVTEDLVIEDCVPQYCSFGAITDEAPPESLDVVCCGDADGVNKSCSLMVRFGRGMSLVIAGAGLMLVGCDRAPVPENDPPIPVAKSDSSADSVVIQPGPSSKREAVERTIGDYKFMVPPHWKERPPKSDFISAEFSIAGEDGPGRITISAAGGGLEANLDRWRGQFQREPSDPEPRESSITLANTEGKLLELHGTFRDGLGNGQTQSEWSMLGAAIPLSSTNLFIKLTGARGTVTKERDHFLRFIETARK